MASARYDVPVIWTPKGVVAKLDKLYLYRDGHANLTFRPHKDATQGIDFAGLNLPLTNAYDVVREIIGLIDSMNDALRKHP